MRPFRRCRCACASHPRLRVRSSSLPPCDDDSEMNGFEHGVELTAGVALVLFVLRAVGLILGFALVYYGLGSPLHTSEALNGFGLDFYLSGVMFLTLGLGNAVPHSDWARLLAVCEGGLGFGFVAVIISYLPVLYSGFSNREANISMLDARAGSPPSASELLRRHAGNLEQLEAYLAEWERWSAQLLESHISYPVLGYFRSQHTNQSWLAALTSILDACSLLLAGCEE